MTYNIILRKHGNFYIARIKEWPEIMVKATQRQTAIQTIKQRLIYYLSQPIEIIPLDLEDGLAKKQTIIDQLCGSWATDLSLPSIFAEIEQERSLNLPREVMF